MCRAVYVLHRRHSNQLNHSVICLQVCFAIWDFEKEILTFTQPGQTASSARIGVCRELGCMITSLDYSFLSFIASHENQVQLNFSKFSKKLCVSILLTKLSFFKLMFDVSLTLCN